MASRKVIIVPADQAGVKRVVKSRAPVEDVEVKRVITTPVPVEDVEIKRVVTTQAPAEEVVQRVVTEEPVVSRVITTRAPMQYEVKRELVETAPGQWSEPSPENPLEYWAQRLAPSISKVLPSPDHRFTATGVSVESEITYRDEVTEDAFGYRTAPPRRVRIKRQRVTLYGTVDRFR